MPNSPLSFASTSSFRNALLSNTTGNDNIAVGTYALRSNTTGISNIAIGQSSLRDNNAGGKYI